MVKGGKTEVVKSPDYVAWDLIAMLNMTIYLINKQYTQGTGVIFSVVEYIISFCIVSLLLHIVAQICKP